MFGVTLDTNTDKELVHLQGPSGTNLYKSTEDDITSDPLFCMSSSTFSHFDFLFNFLSLTQFQTYNGHKINVE